MSLSDDVEPAQGRDGLLARFLRTQWRFLTFGSSPIAREDWANFLAFALGFTWLAGLGRYWDHQSAQWWQCAGLGSLAYVFVLSALLWLIGLPVRPRGWSYSGVLLFVCMTSPPALLYAIPVERMIPLDAAQSVNFWFLAVVAAWRVALLLRFLAVPCGLGAAALILALVPLACIVVALSYLNLEHATFELMANGGAIQTPHDGAYGAVMLLTYLSFSAAGPLLLSYLLLIIWRQSAAMVRNRRAGQEDP